MKLLLLLTLGSAFGFVHVWTVAVQIWATQNIQTVLQYERAINAAICFAVLVFCEFYAGLWIWSKVEQFEKGETC